MTPADLAIANAISFECKKDSLRQTQAGTWKVAFTVIDMDERLTRAMPGTRYQAVLVEIDDNEMPVRKEVMPNHPKPQHVDAQPQSGLDKPRTGAKHMEWRELQPAAQAGIRCDDPVFRKFLEEQDGCPASNADEAANIVRFLCGVESRAELGTNHKARVLWHQLDEHFLAWKYVDA